MENEDRIPAYYLRLTNGDLVEAAILWALDWKRAAIERCVERDQYKELYVSLVKENKVFTDLKPAPVNFSVSA